MTVNIIDFSIVAEVCGLISAKNKVVMHKTITVEISAANNDIITEVSLNGKYTINCNIKGTEDSIFTIA